MRAAIGSEEMFGHIDILRCFYGKINCFVEKLAGRGQGKRCQE